MDVADSIVINVVLWPAGHRGGEEVVMVKLLHRLTASRGRVEFCDSCGQVCTAKCRSEALRDRMRTQTTHFPFSY